MKLENLQEKIQEEASRGRTKFLKDLPYLVVVRSSLTIV